MVRNLEGKKLYGWLEEAAGCEASVIKKFAAGLGKDISAVEGFIHKLKLLKRQGYGRAGLGLLRARMLAA